MPLIGWRQGVQFHCDTLREIGQGIGCAAKQPLQRAAVDLRELAQPDQRGRDDARFNAANGFWLDSDSFGNLLLRQSAAATLFNQRSANAFEKREWVVRLTLWLGLSGKRIAD